MLTIQNIFKLQKNSEARQHQTTVWVIVIIFHSQFLAALSVTGRKQEHQKTCYEYTNEKKEEVLMIRNMRQFHSTSSKKTFFYYPPCKFPFDIFENYPVHYHLPSLFSFSHPIENYIPFLFPHQLPPSWHFWIFIKWKIFGF